MPEAAIVTLTMNPAVDIAVDVDNVMPEHKLRCTAPRFDAGGGGINVARAIRRLGGHPLAIYPAGGFLGHLFQSLIDADEVASRIIPIADCTREDFSVRETSTGDQFRFVLPGPALSGREADACLDALADCVQESGFVVASGSLPRGLSDDFYRRVAQITAAHCARLVLDTSGAPLKAALGSGLYLIKPSRRELAVLIGNELRDERACLSACQKIVADGGAEYVALTLGEEGALLVGHELVLRAKAPRVEPVSAIGAGDSFLGALVWSLATGRTLADALGLAVATGSAALLSPGTGLFTTDDVAALGGKVAVEEALAA